MTVSISSRMVNLDEPVEIGVAGDNAVKVVAFKGVEVLNADNPQAQTVIMKWATTSGDPKAGDVIPLTYESGLWQFTVESSLLPKSTADVNALTATVGDRFMTGIAYAITGGYADMDTTAISAGQVFVNMNYV